MFDPYRPHRTTVRRNGLRTALRAAAWTIAALTPVVWVLHEIGAIQ